MLDLLRRYLALSLLLPLPVLAQGPSGPVRLVVPFAVGGTTDIVGRELARALTDVVGQPVIVDNRTGAGGFIGAQDVARAAPDGTTLLVASVSMVAVAPQLPGLSLPIDPATQLTPIANVVQAPLILVARRDAPFDSVPTLIEQAQTRPGALTYGSSGVGGGSHLAAALFASLAGVELLHVPYRGGAPALLDIIGGNVDMIFGFLPEMLGHLKNGAVKPLAMLSDFQHDSVPGLTPMTHTLPTYRNDYWYAVMGPSGMSNDTVAYWNNAINTALASEALRERLAAQALAPIGGSVDAFRDTIARDRAHWAQLIEQTRIHVE